MTGIASFGPAAQMAHDLGRPDFKCRYWLAAGECAPQSPSEHLPLCARPTRHLNVMLTQRAACCVAKAQCRADCQRDGAMPSSLLSASFAVGCVNFERQSHWSAVGPATFPPVRTIDRRHEGTSLSRKQSARKISLARVGGRSGLECNLW
jgi:hypothetical protein